MKTIYARIMKRTKILMAALLISIPFIQTPAVTQSRIPFSNKNVFLSGANVAWVSFAGDLGPRSASSPNNVNFSRFQTIFQTVHQNGGNVMRLWLFTNGVNTPAFGSNGYVTGSGPYTIQDLRKILILAQQNNIGLILCLWSFDMLSEPPSENMTSTQLSNNYNLLTDTSYTMAFIRNALVPMVDSVKDNPAVVAWEIFNEPEGLAPPIAWGGYQHVQMSDIQRCVNLMAGAIHRADPSALVTNGAVGFFSITDVNPPLSARKSSLKTLNSISPDELKSITDNFNQTHRTDFTVPEMQAFMDKIASLTDYNYYRDDRLIAAGGDPLGTLDFYSVHYYTWEGAAVAPFLVPCSTWNLTKPLVIAEFMFSNLLGSNLFTNLAWSSIYPSIYSNGYAGALEWSYGSAGSSEKSETMQSLSSMHDDHPADVGINIVNQALDASVTASSNDTTSDPASSPLNITDGNISTRWQASSSSSQWVQIDLGKVDSIGRIVIYWAKQTYAEQISVEISSDLKNWSLLKSASQNSSGSDDVETFEYLHGAARYIQFQFTQPRNGPYSISEIQVYGDSASVDSIVPIHTVPTAFALSQNYPNPFNPTTTISYQLPSNAFVTLKVYDILGREVATLVDAEQTAGSHEVSFNGGTVASGVYIYRITAGNHTATRKMVLLK
ncbi:MAG: discoidin domain-containing protein [Bacteroidetes bacterium]|nr:discoidin domain-containing protein [Bacteroidota bacterium]